MNFFLGKKSLKKVEDQIQSQYSTYGDLLGN